MNGDFEKIEEHLFQYHNYKVSLKHTRRQLESLYPRITATYDEIGGGSTGAFLFKSQTEDIAIKRIEKSYDKLKAHMEQYELVISSIDEALQRLNKVNKKFCELRYFQQEDMETIAKKLRYSNRRSVYEIRNRVGEELAISLRHLLYISI